MFKFKPLFFFSVLLVSFAVSSKQSGKPHIFGEPIKAEKTSTLSELIANFDQIKDKKVTVIGKVDKVCQMKGCWLTLKDKTHEVRVMFKDYGFSVPKDIANREVKVEGVLSKKMIKPKQQKHFLEDAKASKKEIDAVREAKEVYRFTATGVELI